MQQTRTRPADSYSPLYFLASLGAGGLAVTFFMYLMFWVPHPGQPVPVFEDILAAFRSGALPMKAAIVIAVTGIAGFAFLNIKLLVWNLRQLSAFSRTEGYRKLVTSNAETTLLAMPLALAMTVNAMFILGLVFVPGLWAVVEYLFPAALLAFAAIAWIAFRRIGRFLGRVLSEGGVFDVTANNSFAQLLPAFALSMTAVGMAAPAAMSTQPLTVGVSLVLSVALGSIAALYAVIAAVVAFNSMLHHGTAKESAPTLMVVVPILTILGIMMMRQDHGLHTTFATHGGMADTLILTTTILAIQGVFIALGLLVLPAGVAPPELRRRLPARPEQLGRVLRPHLPRRGAQRDDAFLDQQGPRRGRADRQVRRRLLGPDRAGHRRAGGDDRAGLPPQPPAFRQGRGGRAAHGLTGPT
jgi:hypothetical protein